MFAALDALGDKGAALRDSLSGKGPAVAPAVGDLVKAKIAGWKKPYKGTVTKSLDAGKAFTVRFEDGEIVERVKLAEMLEVMEKAKPAVDLSQLRTGARVSAKVAGWKRPYSGEILSQGGDTFAVLFDDGERIDDVALPEILEVLAPISAARELDEIAVGAHVSAQIKGWKKPYNGTVTAALSDGTFTIEFDDGEVVDSVTPAEIKEVHGDGAPSSEGSVAVAVAARVSAKIAGWKKPYDGTVEATNGDGTFKVVFDDGEVVERVLRAEILKVHDDAAATDALVAAGARVSAKISGWKKPYDGTVKAANADGTFEVVFDDGEVVKGVTQTEIVEVLHHAPEVGASAGAASDQNDDGGGDNLEAERGMPSAGARVSAKISGWKKHYDGTVKAANADGTFEVVFDDGEVVKGVTQTEIVEVLHPAPEVGASAGTASDLNDDGGGGALSAGARVSAKISGWKKPYEGTVKAANADGTFEVVFDDGEVVEAVQPTEIVEVLHPAPKVGASTGTATGLNDDGSGDNLEAERGMPSAGARVSAKISGWKKPYDGTVKAANADGTFEVVFDDGEVVEAVQPTEIVEVLHPAPEVGASAGTATGLNDDGGDDNLEAERGMPSAGARVSAKISGWKKPYDGTVKAANADGTFEVVFDDGEVVKNVTQTEILQIHQAAKPPSCTAAEGESELLQAHQDVPSVGARISAQVSGWKQPYEGTIEVVRPDGSCKVVFDDGEIVENVSAVEIVAVIPAGQKERVKSAPHHGLSVGTRVRARITGWKTGYDGVIHAVVAKDLYCIHFDDGEIQEKVTPDEIESVLSAPMPPKPGSPRAVDSGGLSHDQDLLNFLNDEGDALSCAAGDLVMARLESWPAALKAKVASLDPNSKEYTLELGDGEQVVAKEEHIVSRLPPGAALEPEAPTTAAVDGAEPAVGDTVRAKVKGWKSAYKGVIKRLNAKDKSFKIIFEDGQAVNKVPRDCIVEILERAPPKAGAASEWVAPDGKVFTDRTAYKRHMLEHHFSFKNLADRKDLLKVPGSIDGQPFELHTLENCTVRLLCWSSQVQADALQGCKVFIGPCESSVFVRDCRNCEFTIACRQLRLRDCRDCTFNLFSNVDPVIETSTDLTFRPFNGAYPGLGDHFTRAKLDPRDNHWREIFDFNVDGADGFGVPDPHYKLEEAPGGVLAEEWIEADVSGAGVCANPVAADAVATTQSDGGSTHRASAHKPTASTVVQQAQAPRKQEDMVFEWAAALGLEHLEEGTIVRVNFRRDSANPLSSDFYQGVVKSTNPDGTVVVHYEDGDVEKDCKLEFIKVGSKLGVGALATAASQDPRSPQAQPGAPQSPQPSAPEEASKQKAKAEAEAEAEAEVADGAANEKGAHSKDLSERPKAMKQAFQLEPVTLPSPAKARQPEAAQKEGPPPREGSEIAVVSRSRPCPSTPSLVFGWATSADQVPDGAVVLVNQRRTITNPSWSDLSKGVALSQNEDGSFRVQLDDGSIEERCPLEQIQVGAPPGEPVPTWRSPRRGPSGSRSPRHSRSRQQREAPADPISEKVLAELERAREELKLLREQQLADQRRMLQERKAQERRILEERAKQAQQATISRQHSEQAKMLDLLREEIADQKHVQAQLMEEHERAMAQLAARVDTLGDTPEPSRVEPHRPSVVPALLPTTESRCATDLDNIRHAIESVRHALKRDMKQASLDAQRMDAMTAQRELERGWNRWSSGSDSGRRGRSRSASAPRRVQRATTPAATGRARASSVGHDDPEEIQRALAELEDVKRERTRFLLSLRRQDGIRGRSRARTMSSASTGSSGGAGGGGEAPQAVGNVGLSPDASAGLKRAQRLLDGLYEVYVSQKTGRLVQAPTPAEIRTPAWTQRVAELKLKPISFQSRAHDDDKWRAVGRALCRISCGLVPQRARRGALAVDLRKSWVDWTIASNKDLNNVTVSRKLARRMGFLDGGSTVADIDLLEGETEIFGLSYTHRQCERRLLKPRLGQQGDYARAHIVPDPPLSPEVRLRNTLYKQLCLDEWERFQEYVEQELTLDGAFEQLRTWAKEDSKAKNAELQRRREARKAEAAQDFAQWRSVKERTEVKSNTLATLKTEADGRGGAYPRPAGAPTNLAAAFRGDRAVPLRYVGGGHVPAGETNYMTAAHRASLPAATAVNSALHSHLDPQQQVHGRPATVWAGKSHDQHNPWGNVDASKRKLQQLESRMSCEQQAAAHRAAQAQTEFVAWEHALRAEERARKMVKSLDFAARCLRNENIALVPEVTHQPGGVSGWLCVGQALHAIEGTLTRSASLFQAWVEWTTTHVLTAMGRPSLCGVPCGLVEGPGGEVVLCYKPGSRDKFARGAMVVLVPDKGSAPEGEDRLSAESLAVLLDKGTARLAVVDVSGSDDHGGTLPLRGSAALKSHFRLQSHGASCVAYVVPQLLAKLLFAGSGASKKTTTSKLMNRVKDSERLTGQIRSLCTDSWARFAVPVCWFAGAMSWAEEACIQQEVAAVRRMYSSERIRARLAERDSPEAAAEIREYAHGLWQAAVDNRSLRCSEATFQSTLSGPAATVPLLGGDGQPIGVGATAEASLRCGDFVCLVAANGASTLPRTAAKQRAEWCLGDVWRVVTGMNAVCQSVTLARTTLVQSAGKGALVYRVALSAEPSDEESPESEMVHISKLAGALVLRTQVSEAKCNQEEAMPSGYLMFHLPSPSTLAQSHWAQLAAWSCADVKKAEEEVRCAELMQRDQHLETVREVKKSALRRCEVMLLGGQPASAQLVTRSMDKVGSILHRLHSLETEPGEGRSEPPVREAAWKTLWARWVETSEKWAEFNRLGFELEDLHAMIDKRWAELGAQGQAEHKPGTQARRKSRGERKTAALLLSNLQSLLVST